MIPRLLQTRYSSSLQSPGDLCVSASTGSGKTLAYCIPILDTLYNRVIPRIRALIIVPTRDLAFQVKSTFESINKLLNIGVSIGQQSFAQEQKQFVSTDPDDVWTETGGSSNIDILISTPGRLTDHISTTPGFTLKHLKFLVIDEADRLLNQSYHGWLSKVLEATESTTGNIHSSNVQKLLFSATLTRNPSKIASLHLFNPTYICVAEEDLERRYVTPTTLVEHMLVADTSAEKPLQILSILFANLKNTLVFVKSVQAVERLTFLIVNAAKEYGIKFNVNSLASDSTQAQRKAIMQGWNQNDMKTCLICSDMSARGLDLDQVEVIINYDIPATLKTYIHRIGRTARAGSDGIAISLLDSTQAKWFKKHIMKSDKVSRSTPMQKMKISKSDLDKVEICYEKALASLQEAYTFAKKTGAAEKKEECSSSSSSSSDSESSSASSSDDLNDMDMDMYPSGDHAKPLEVHAEWGSDAWGF